MSHPADAVYVDGVAVAKGDVRTYEGRVLHTADIATEVQGQALPNCLFILATAGGGDKVFAYDSASVATHDGTTVLVDASGRRYLRDPDLTSADIISTLASGAIDLGKIDPGSTAAVMVGRKTGSSVLAHLTQSEIVAELDTHFSSTDWRTRDKIDINPAAASLPGNAGGMFGADVRGVVGTDGHVYLVGGATGGGNGVAGGTNTRRLKRLATESPVQFVKMWLGAQSGFALDVDGYVWSWGGNSLGVLGHGDTANRTIAKRIDYFVTNAITIADVIPALAGDQTTCYGVLFIGTNGRLYYAGYNNRGEAGLGNTTQQNTPVEWGLGAMGTDCAMAAIAEATGVWVAAVTSTGDLKSAGDDSYGQQGQGSAVGSRNTVQTGALANVADIKISEFGALARTTDGKAHYSGYNAYGQAGNGATGGNVTSFAQITALGTDVTDIALCQGSHGSLAVILDLSGSDEVRLWGRNNAGQLGDGTTTDRNVPIDPGDVWQGGVTRVDFGGDGSGVVAAIVEAGGALYASGYQGQGNASIGSIANVSSFARVVGYSGTIADWAVCGRGSSWGLQVLCDQHVYSGGYNASGQTGVAERDDANQAVLQAMLMPAIAARSDKVLAAFGAYTQTKVVEEELTLSGATVDSAAAQIHDRAIVLGVSVRVTESVTGATSFDVGDGTTADKFGGALSIIAGDTNIGVIGPTAYYTLTAIRLTANGGNFTGGKVRLALHTLEFGAPSS